MYWTISIFICKLCISNFTFGIWTVISNNYIYLSSTLSYWIPDTPLYHTHSLGIVINELLKGFYFIVVDPDIYRHWQISQWCHDLCKKKSQRVFWNYLINNTIIVIIFFDTKHDEKYYLKNGWFIRLWFEGLPQLPPNTSHHLLPQYARPGFYNPNISSQGTLNAYATYMDQTDEEDLDNHSVCSNGPSASDHKNVTVQRSSRIAMKGKSTTPGPLHPKSIVQRRLASTPSLNGNNLSWIPVSGGSLTWPPQLLSYKMIPKTVGMPEAIIADPKIRSYLSTIDGVVTCVIH